MTYYFTTRDAFTTPDRSCAPTCPSTTASSSPGVDLFLQPEVLNVFNRHTVDTTDPAVRHLDLHGRHRGACTTPTGRCLPFNPFTEKPVEGVNWQKGPNFGKALNPFGFQQPRTFRFGSACGSNRRFPSDRDALRGGPRRGRPFFLGESSGSRSRSAAPSLGVSGRRSRGRAAGRGTARWPWSSASAISPRRRRRAKPGAGAKLGRSSARPRARLKSRLVTGSGARQVERAVGVLALDQEADRADLVRVVDPGEPLAAVAERPAGQQPEGQRHPAAAPRPPG